MRYCLPLVHNVQAKAQLSELLLLLLLNLPVLSVC
jgi:hypothetical protein